MYRHIVMWKMADAVSASSKPEILAHVKQVLEKMEPKIEAISRLEVGLNKAAGMHVADIVLLTDFEDIAAYQRYQSHPTHMEAVAALRPYLSDRREVDYQIS